jgi:hypothetical protein
VININIQVLKVEALHMAFVNQKSWKMKFSEWKAHGIYFTGTLTVPEDVMQLKRRDITFVSNVTYLCVTFDRRMARRHRVESNVVKALHMYIITDSLFRSGRLSTNINLTFLIEL